MKTTFLFLAVMTAAGTINAMQHNNYSPPKPSGKDGCGIIVQSDVQTSYAYDYDNTDLWWYDPFKTGNPWGINNDSVVWTTTDINQHWDHIAGGEATTTHTFDYTHGYEDWDSGEWINETPTHWDYYGAWRFLPGNPSPYDYQNHDYTLWTGDTNGISLNTPLGSEHCDVQINTEATIYSDYGWTEDHIRHSYARHAQTRMQLVVGGRAIPGRLVLEDITASANDMKYIEAQPPYFPSSIGAALPPTEISIGSLGRLGADGHLWRILPAGTVCDATPVVNGHDFYIFHVEDPPSALLHVTKHPALDDPDKTNRLTLGVGEEVDLSGMRPGTVWTATAGGLTISANSNSATFTAPSNAPAGGGKATVKADFPGLNGGPWTVDFTVKEPTGVDPVHTYIIETNFFPISQLQYGQAAAGMHLHVVMQPTGVSFYRVKMEEVGEDATNATGYFTSSYPPPSHIGNGADNPFTLNWDNSWPEGDYCYSHYQNGFGFPTTLSGLWFPGGSFTWNIPWNWWITGSSHTNFVTLGWQQVYELDPYGTVKITKFGNKWVQRTSSGTIINSP
jgi:hypothetical protein